MRRLLGLIAIVLTWSSTLVGYSASNTCSASCCVPQNDSCCGTFTLGADALYWRPSVGGIYYADLEVGLVTDPQVDDQLFYSRPGWEWGWRVRGRYDSGCGNLFVRADYAWWREGFKGDPVTGGTATSPAIYSPFLGSLFLALQPVVGTGPVKLTNTKADFNYRYQHFNIVAGWELCRSCCYDVSVVGGLRYFRTKAKERYVGQTAEDTAGGRPAGSILIATQSCKLDGVGPRIGFDVSVNPWCGLGVHALLGASFLFAEEKDYLTAFAEDPGLGGALQEQLNRYPTLHRVVPEIDTTLGVSYTVDCWCVSATIEAGVEWHHYFDATDRVVGTNANPVQSPEIASGFGVGGAYIGGSLSY